MMVTLFGLDWFLDLGLGRLCLNLLYNRVDMVKMYMVLRII